MGIKGLWRLIANCGTPVSLESLEHKILAVDVSIWLHQAVRGFRGFGGGSVANAHLLTLFHRICKLLFYRIRPVFVFDGGVPQLKRQTLSSRRLRREAAAGKAEKVRDRLLSNLLRSHAVRDALGKRGPGPSLHRVSKPVKREKDLFELPPLAKPLDDRTTKTSIGSDSEEEEDLICRNMNQKNLHNFEYDDHKFKSLPLETQHEILSELQITRKENSWHTLNEMPQEANSFSSFQMNRLMKRNSFQKKLDDIRSEIKKINTAEIEATLFGDLEKHVSLTHKIISEDATHSILVKNIKETPVQDNQTKFPPVKGKSKKSDVKQDFLTELAKQGIVSYDFNENGKRNFDSSFSLSSDDDDIDSLSEDEAPFSTKKKKKLDEVAFLKAVDLVLDDSELTQEEIFSLIKQTQLEVESESAKSDDKNLVSKMKDEDLQKPSTSSSAPGIIYNSDAESTDDDDFIDVSDPELESADINNCKREKEDTKLSPQKTEMQSSNMNDSNVEKILGAKTDSLYIKILQQKLGDMVQTSSNTKNLVDTRKLDNESNSKQSMSSPTKDNVMISLNLKNNTDISFEDDIFNDIFNPKKGQRVESNISSDKPQENRVILDLTCGKINGNVVTPKLTCNNSENLVNFNSSCDSTDVSLSKREPVTEEKATFENVEHSIDLKSIKITEELRQKISELVREEVTNIIKNSSMQNTSHKESENKSSALNKDFAVCIQPPEKELSIQINEEVSNKNISKVNSDLEISTSSSKPSDVIESGKDHDPDKLHITPSRINTECNMRNTDLDKLPESRNNSDYDENSTSSEGKETERFRLVSSGNNTDIKNVELPKQPCLNPIKYSVDDLEHMENELRTEETSLLAEINQAERVAVDISDQMYGEAQELLKIFGLPYLVAPMEAEAQCAFLDIAKLTHGTITNDSDIFLFGGKRVYKNFFNQDKHVECFTVDNIQHNIGLNRNKMITLALLTGSDYTIGIESVGAVLGMEILSEFPGSGIECLKNLKKWWNVASKNVCNIQASKAKQRLSRLYFPESFPNENIFTAYLRPEVDESKEKFSWGIPSVENLRTFTAEKFGWNIIKTDEIILPVFKKLGIKETQTRIDAYFNNIKLVKEPHNKSKRLQDAIARAKEDNAVASKDVDAISTSEKKAIKRTLLMDPSQGNYGHTLKKKRGRKKEKVPSEEEEKSTEGTSQGTIVNKKSKKLQKPTEKLEDPTEASYSKEEKKKQIYMKLQEKEKITQLEAEKIEKNRKKTLAIEILSKSRTKK